MGSATQGKEKDSCAAHYHARGRTRSWASLARLPRPLNGVWRLRRITEFGSTGRIQPADTILQAVCCCHFSFCSYLSLLSCGVLCDSGPHEVHGWITTETSGLPSVFRPWLVVRAVLAPHLNFAHAHSRADPLFGRDTSRSPMSLRSQILLAYSPGGLPLQSLTPLVALSGLLWYDSPAPTRQDGLFICSLPRGHIRMHMEVALETYPQGLESTGTPMSSVVMQCPSHASTTPSGQKRSFIRHRRA